MSARISHIVVNVSLSHFCRLVVIAATVVFIIPSAITSFFINVIKAISVVSSSLLTSHCLHLVAFFVPLFFFVILLLFVILSIVVVIGNCRLLLLLSVVVNVFVLVIIFVVTVLLYHFFFLV